MYMSLYGYMFSLLLGKYLVVKWLGCMLNGFNFMKLPNCFPKLFFLLFFYFLSFCYFFGPLPRHMEVPRLGVESEPTPEPQQLGIRAASATYTVAHSNARSWTHWVRPGINPATSWFLVRFINHCTTMGSPPKVIFPLAVYESSSISYPSQHLV